MKNDQSAGIIDFCDGAACRLKEITAAYEELTAAEEELRQQFDALMRREKDVQRQNMVLTSLHELALELMKNPGLDDVLRLIAVNAAAVLGTAHGFIRLVDEEKSVFRYQIGLGQYALDVGREIDLYAGLSGQVYRTGEVAIVDDYSAWENRLPDPFFDQVRAIAHVPLKEGDKVIGTFGVAFLTPERKFTDQDIFFLSRFADLASIALKNARLLAALGKSEKDLQRKNEEITAAHEELQASDEELRQQFEALLDREEKIRQQNMALHAVHEAALGLMRRLDLDEVLMTIISGAARLLNMPDGYINLVDENEGVFVRKVAIGRFVQDMARQTNLTEGLLGEAYATGKIAFVNDYSAWEQRLADSIFDGLYCCVVVPLKLGDKVIGALGLGSSEAGRTLTEHEIYLLQRFADMAAIAIDNASMFTAYKNELLERRRTEEALKVSEEKYRAIFAFANDGILIQDMSSGKIIDVNRKIQEMYGYTREEILAGNAQLFAAGDPSFTEHEAGRRIKLAAAGEPQLFEWQGRRKDGRVIPVEISVRRTMIGNQDCLLSIVRDIAERKEQEKAICRMAYSDALTGLPNRAHLKEFLARELEKSRRGETAGAIFFVDLDDLKTINDTFGHSYGDSVIANTGSCICAAVGAGAFVARSGSDEFVVVLPGETDRQRLQDIAGHMVQKLGRDYAVGASRAYLSASVGIALYPADGSTAEDILRSADLALYAAKSSGKNKWCFYEDRLKEAAFSNMVLKQGLREAIERNELYLAYQPLFCTHTAAVVSFEALLRWHSAEFGAVPPGKFIPLAEESDIIQIIGKWVMREACRFARKLAELGRSDISVSVNVSPRQLAADDFVAFVRDTLRTAGINPSQIEIEITENVLIASMEDISQKLKELKEIGVHLTLDDFGSGYCSLLYLKNLPVATLKIDKSFIDGIDADEAQWRFVNSIVNMAKVQNLTVVAEGVETVAQLTKLRQCQCDYIQGYVFSRPIAETEALSLLKRTAEN